MKTTPSHSNQPTIESLQAQVEELTAKVRGYEEQFHLSQQKRFGTSSEKIPNNQIAPNRKHFPLMILVGRSL
nr:hypothetical protein [Bacillus sp. AR13-1]